MKKKHKRKIRIGTVVSDRMNKTRVVKVQRTVRHLLYEKVMRPTKKYYVHDENNISHIGDKVEIIETRPLSKLKCWRIKTVLK